MHSICRPLFLILCAAALLPVAAARANEKAEPDPAKSPYWEPIRKIMFGDREILDGKQVVQVYLPCARTTLPPYR